MNRKIAAVISAGYALALRSIRLQIQRHALGYAWTFIIPTLYAVCYIYVKRDLTGGAAMTHGEGGLSILRAFAGIMLFQGWFQIVQQMADLIRNQRGMLRGLDVGPGPFILAVAIEGGVALVIRFALILVAIPVLNVTFPIGFLSWLWFIGSMFALILSALAVGLILAPWAALYGDVRKALSSLNLPLVLISPIFYPAVEHYDSMLYWVNVINPLAPPLAIMADAVQGKSWSFYAIPFLGWIVLSLILLAWSFSQLHRQIPILLERIGK